MAEKVSKFFVIPYKLVSCADF